MVATARAAQILVVVELLAALVMVGACTASVMAQRRLDAQVENIAEGAHYLCERIIGQELRRETIERARRAAAPHLVRIDCRDPVFNPGR